jgi:type I restriction enzyme M protein
LHEQLIAGEGDYAGADPEDPDEYKAENVFFVPIEARWLSLQAKAKLPTIGQLVDEAMEVIERENPKLPKGILPKVYGQQKLDPTSLGGLIDNIGSVNLAKVKAESDGQLRLETKSMGEPPRQADLLGQVYEYFLGQFALAEGKKGGQFYTPEAVVRVLVEMLEPYKGRVFDPCCGSGGVMSHICWCLLAHPHEALISSCRPTYLGHDPACHRPELSPQQSPSEPLLLRSELVERDWRF